MKNRLHNSLRALILSLAVLLSLPMLAEHIEVGGINYDVNIATKKATVIAKSRGRYSGEMVIPESVEFNGTAYSVTSIGDNAFRGCFGLTSVTIPNSVKSIEKAAFAGCLGLSSLTIPNSVESIKAAAFSSCEGLTSVTLGKSVRSIGNIAFYGCSSLASIVVDAGNRVYDSRNNCNAIIATASNTLLLGCNNTIIPNSVTSIKEYAFSGCEGLTSITIPNSVVSIKDNAFEGCSGLTSVTLGKSVKSIGNTVFYDCSSLASIVVDAGNKVYDSRNNCNAIIATASNTLVLGCKNTVIPNNVTSIGGGAFYKCSGLTSVTIPNSVTSIGDNAFEHCSGLTSVTIGDSVTSIGNWAFRGCSGLTSITIPNSVTSIGDYACYECPKLRNIYCYAEKLPSIGTYAFVGSLPENATLHVPAASAESYKATEPWNGFGKIVALKK